MIPGVFRQFSGAALYTVKVAARRPLCLLLVMMTLALMLLLPSIVAFNLGEENRLTRDGSLALFAVSGTFLALASPAAAAYEPASAGVLALNMCSPAGRTVLLFGRYAGLAALMVWHGLLAMAGVLLSERIALPAPRFDATIMLVVVAAAVGAAICAAWLNFRGRASFSGAAMAALFPAMLLALAVAGCIHPAGGWCRFGRFLDWRLLPAGGLITLALLVMAALALLLTVRWPLHLATAAYMGALAAGALVDFLAQRAPAGSALSVLVRVLPAWQDFWAVEALAGGGRLDGAYCAAAAVYAGLYIAALLCGALCLFWRWEPR